MRRYVVDQDGAGGTTVVGARDGAEALCTSGVPELELDSFAAGWGADFYDFGGEFDADCLGGEGANWRWVRFGDEGKTRGVRDAHSFLTKRWRRHDLMW